MARRAEASVAVLADITAYQQAMAKIPGVTGDAALKAAKELERELRKGSERAAKAAEAASKSAADASSSVGKFSQHAELFERMRAALGPLGDVLGDVTGGADDLGTALKGFSKAQIAMAAGTLIAVAALVKLGQATFDVLANLEDYSEAIERLQTAGFMSAADLESMEAANESIEYLKQVFGDVVVMIAARVAPAFRVVADLLSLVGTGAKIVMASFSMLTGNLGGTTEAVKKTTAALNEYNSEWLVTLTQQGKADEALAKADAARKAAAATREFLLKLAKDEDAAAARAAARRAKADAAEVEFLKLKEGAFIAEMDAVEKINHAFGVKAQRLRELVDLNPALKEQAAALIEFLEQTEQDTVFAQLKKEAEALDKTLQAAHDKEMKRRAEARKEAAKAAAAIESEQAEVRDTMFASADALTGYVSQSLSSVAMAFDTTTAQGKKAARTMAVMQRTLAIFQVGLNLAQAIAQSFGQAGPIAGAALAVAVGAAFAGIIAAVAAPIPKFHTGRFAAGGGGLTDEAVTGGAMTVRPEVIIPPDLVSRVGGPGNVRQRLEGGDRPLIVQAVIDLADERIVLPLSRAMGARERGRIGSPLGRST